MCVKSSLQVERAGGDTTSGPCMDSKDALTRYVHAYPEVQRALSARRVRDGGASRTEEDATAVGFGPHAQMTYGALYGAAELKRLVITVCEEFDCLS